jgi:hypothetical protein
VEVREQPSAGRVEPEPDVLELTARDEAHALLRDSRGTLHVVAAPYSVRTRAGSVMPTRHDM